MYVILLIIQIQFFFQLTELKMYYSPLLKLAQEEDFGGMSKEVYYYHSSFQKNSLGILLVAHIKALICFIKQPPA